MIQVRMEGFDSWRIIFGSAMSSGPRWLRICRWPTPDRSGRTIDALSVELSIGFARVVGGGRSPGNTARTQRYYGDTSFFPIGDRLGVAHCSNTILNAAERQRLTGDVAATGSPGFTTVIALISAIYRPCYRPVMVPVILLPPGMRVFRKRLENKVFSRPGWAVAIASDISGFLPVTGIENGADAPPAKPCSGRIKS